MLGRSIVRTYSAVGLAAALSVSGGHEGRGEEDGGAHSCCVWEVLLLLLLLLLLEVIDVCWCVYVQRYAVRETRCKCD